MILILRLFITAILLLFLSIFLLTDFDNVNASLNNKLLLFIFVFMIQFTISIVSNMMNKRKIIISDISKTSLNYGILAVVGYDVFKDLNYQQIFSTSTRMVKVVIMVMIVTMFLTITKLIQMLFLYEA